MGFYEKQNEGVALELTLNPATTKAASTEVHRPIEAQGNELADDDFAVLSFRNLLFDICNKNGGGHGGSAVGMAAIGVALFRYVMRYNPSNPAWFDRDRFVLSNGES